VTIVNRNSKSGLVGQFCTPLCLQRTGSKEELVDRILEFLLNPSDDGLVSVSGVHMLYVGGGRAL